MARRIAATALVATALGLAPSPADAGGNWLELRREDEQGASTYGVFARGDRVVAWANVYAQGPWKRDLLAGGPFVAWLRPEAPRYGGPRAAVAPVRLGTFTVRRLGPHVSRVTVRFSVPAVPSGGYEVTICDDPCAVRGFGEGVQGWIQVVRTPAAARLLTRAWERRWTIYELRRELKQAEDDLGHLGLLLDRARSDRRELAGQVQALQRALALDDASPAAADPTRPDLVVMLGLGALIAAAAATAGSVWARRRPRVTIPDTVEELLSGTAGERTIDPVSAGSVRTAAGRGPSRRPSRTGRR